MQVFMRRVPIVLEPDSYVFRRDRVSYDFPFVAGCIMELRSFDFYLTGDLVSAKAYVRDIKEKRTTNLGVWTGGPWSMVPAITLIMPKPGRHIRVDIRSRGFIGETSARMVLVTATPNSYRDNFTLA